MKELDDIPYMAVGNDEPLGMDISKWLKGDLERDEKGAISGSSAKAFIDILKKHGFKEKEQPND